MPHPQGEFEATIHDHGFDESSKGTPFLWVEFETTADHANRITGYFYLSSGAAPHSMKKVRAMGFLGDDLEALTDGTALKGNRCRLTVEHEEYEGKTRAKIAFVNSMTGGRPDLKHDNATAKKAARFNVLLRQEPLSPAPVADAPAQPATPSAAPAEAATEEEIPF